LLNFECSIGISFLIYYIKIISENFKPFSENLLSYLKKQFKHSRRKMMKYFGAVFTFCLSVLTVVCNAETLFSELQYRDGIYYKLNSDQPYSGTITEYYKNGQKHFIANYKDGKLDGKFIEWYENGIKKSWGRYENNKLHGELTMWLENGQKRFIKHYVNGKLDGVSRQWHLNGKKYYVKHYKNDSLDGEAIEWWNNGQLRYKRHYKKVKLIGERIEWDEKGKRK